MCLKLHLLHLHKLKKYLNFAFVTDVRVFNSNYTKGNPHKEWLETHVHDILDLENTNWGVTALLCFYLCPNIHGRRWFIKETFQALKIFFCRWEDWEWSQFINYLTKQILTKSGDKLFLIRLLFGKTNIATSLWNLSIRRHHSLRKCRNEINHLQIWTFLNANHANKFTFSCHKSQFHCIKNCHRLFILTTSKLNTTGMLQVKATTWISDFHLSNFPPFF